MTEKNTPTPQRSAGIVSIGIALLIGLAVLGLCIYSGLKSISQGERVVTVRGLAEQEVKADRVIWPISYKTTGADLQGVYAQTNRASQKIKNFLTRNGIPAQDITTASPEIIDLRTDRYSRFQGTDPYNVTLVTTVTSNQVDKVRQLMPRMGELMKEGIAISPNEYGNSVQYQFTSLNKIKPKMIEDATRNAREAAEKFAKDSDSKLGKIKTAQQGLFSIEDRDSYTPYIKKVRVVTTVDFFLES